MIPVAIKVGILFLVLMAPFKWEKELGALLEKGQAMGRQAIGTAAGMAFGALPYVMKKKMDAGSTKVAGEDLVKMRHNQPAEYATEMAKMKTTRAEQYVDDEIMKNNGFTEQSELDKLKGDPALYLAEQNRVMGNDGLAGIVQRLDDEIEINAEKSASGLKTGTPEEKQKKIDYVKAQIENVNHQDLKKQFAKQYEGSVIPLWNAGNILGIKIPAIALKPQVTGNAVADAASRAKIAPIGKGLMTGLDIVQKYNPMGLASAWKERTELNAKNIEKSHYRSSKFTELALGPEAALKHQMAIQKEDMGHIYTSDGMRGSQYWKSYQKAVRKLATEMGVSMKEAGDHFRTELRRMQEEQAPKTEYNEYLGGLVGSNDSAAIIEGYDRASTIIAQEARSQKPRSLIQMEAQTAESSWHDMHSGPADPPTPLEAHIGNGATQVATDPNLSAANINQTYNFQNMTTDDFAGLVTQRGHIMDDIRKNLTTRGIQPGPASIIIQALRDHNGEALPTAVVREINKDSGLKDLTSRFQTMRKTEIDAISSTAGGSDLLYRTMADSIAKSIVNSGTIRDAISKARSGTPAEADAAKRTIASAIKQNSAMVDLHTVDLVEQGLQIIETQ